MTTLTKSCHPLSRDEKEPSIHPNGIAELRLIEESLKKAVNNVDQSSC